MPFPYLIELHEPPFWSGARVRIQLNAGLTALIGPNGTGKSRALRRMSTSLASSVRPRKVRYLSANRLSVLEHFRSNVHGNGISSPEGASLGDRNTGRHRDRSESAVGAFHALDARPDLLIKVQTRLQTLFRRRLNLTWDAGNLKVQFSNEHGEQYDGAAEASGLLNLVVILSALYDEDVGALVIDEPEVSLHPQLQAFLFKELEAVAGDPSSPDRKLIVYATHSPEFVRLRRPTDLCNLIFFSSTRVAPKQVSSDDGLLKKKKLAGLFARLGYTHKAALFSTRPLLVEGPSDEIVCAAIDRRLELNLAAGDAALVPVIGKTEIPDVAKLMSAAGKEPTLLADLDGLVDGPELTNVLAGSPVADDLARKAGHTDFAAFSTTIRNSIFGAVTRIDPDWDALVERSANPSTPAGQGPDATKELRRARVAALLTASDAELAASQAGDRLRQHRTQLIAFLDLLEKCGLFILRRGAIESYYTPNMGLLASGKPEHAVQQAAAIESMEPEAVRALQHVVRHPPVSERNEVVELVHAVVGPAIARLRGGRADIESIPTNLLGDRGRLFSVRAVEVGARRGVEVSLNSKILQVRGFPLTISESEDAVWRVDETLL